MAEARAIRRAMVLAAGRGERMRPLTDRLPKPLIEVHGKAMLDTILDRLAAEGVEHSVVNLHHLGELIEDHIAKRTSAPRVHFSREECLLDTGGGVRKALPELGADPFYVVNGDISWLDARETALERLRNFWNPDEMDALLLLHPTVFAIGYDGWGDFVMDACGRLRRRDEREIAPFVFAGVQIVHPRLFEGAPDGRFSMNRLYDAAAERGRLWGLRHDGEWFHVGTPEALDATEEALQHLDFPTVHR